MIRIRFSADDTSPFSRLTRWVTGSEWSHAELLYGDDWGIGSMPFDGVCSRRIPSHEKFKIISIEGDLPKALQWVSRQLGSPYDYLGIVGFAVPGFDWQDPGSWYCFELIAGLLKDQGFNDFDTLKRVQADDLLATLRGYLCG